MRPPPFLAMAAAAAVRLANAVQAFPNGEGGFLLPPVGKRKTDEGRPPQAGVTSAASHRGVVVRFSPPLCKGRWHGD